MKTILYMVTVLTVITIIQYLRAKNELKKIVPPNTGINLNASFFPFNGYKNK